MMTKAHYYLLQWDHSNTYFSLTECQKLLNQIITQSAVSSDYVMVNGELKPKSEASESLAVFNLKNEKKTKKNSHSN